MSEDIPINIAWNFSLETYFKQIGEKAQGNAILHAKAEKKFSKLKMPLDLGIIVIGTINGFVSVGSEQIFQSWPYASLIVGLISLFCSILSTISSYHSYGKVCENHHQVSIQYAKLYRFLALELNLAREHRMSPHDLLKMTKETYDRLAEVSLPIPDDILEAFKKQYKDYPRVRRPSGANGLEELSIYLIKNIPSTDGIANSPNAEREQTSRPSSQEISLQESA